MTPPRLLEQVRARIRARHYSRRTEDAYVHWIRRYIVFHSRRHPRELGAPEISAFLTWLAVEQHVAASTQNQALSGVLFLYREVLCQEVGVVALLPRARMPSKVPVVLSPSEVRQVLNELAGVSRIVATLLYVAVRASGGTVTRPCTGAARDESGSLASGRRGTGGAAPR